MFAAFEAKLVNAILKSGAPGKSCKEIIGGQGNLTKIVGCSICISLLGTVHRQTLW